MKPTLPGHPVGWACPLRPAVSWIVSLLFFYKNGFSIKYSMMVEMPLNKETDQLPVRSGGSNLRKTNLLCYNSHSGKDLLNSTYFGKLSV